MSKLDQLDHLAIKLDLILSAVTKRNGLNRNKCASCGVLMNGRVPAIENNIQEIDQHESIRGSEYDMDEDYCEEMNVPMSDLPLHPLELNDNKFKSK